ncbi:hypothetical protein [Litorimonas sp. WD9-15]|uniref:hypothetical protein n=1 Tax=Litorimonas sp. WD9-15 TaxID=3418716 RepID=UPI003D0225BA
MTHIIDTAMIKAGFEVEDIRAIKHRRELYIANLIAMTVAIGTFTLTSSAWA